ncbi:MAG: GNAT family N-acetyltransferase, partial [bacterium]|nr:GNAT family N-acetyltransferase [bacterium]
MSNDYIEIFPATSKQDRKKLVKFPWEIYKHDPCWVPPLIRQQLDNVNKNKHPFFEHSEVDFFLATRNNKLVGTVAAILNNRHNQFHQENVGFFGFFETINDYQVAEKLLDTVMEWGKQKNLHTIRGPENYSQNEICGLLVDGFNYPPAILMGHNPPYYQTFIEQYGFVKAMDLWAYYLDAETMKMSDRVIKVVNRIKQRSQFTFRKINKKDIKNEIERVKQIYNKAWEMNWGFVPLTDHEIDHIAKELVQIIDEDVVYFAELNGKPVGFSLSCPDINQALIKINGRLFPFGLFKLLYHIRKINRLRVIIMGVLP